VISLADLNEIKRSYREPEGVQIVVRLGICGASVGAKEVFETFKNVVKEKGITGVRIYTTGCIGLCSQEPVVDVVVPGMPRVTYTFVTPEKARGIIFHHIERKQIIKEWVIPNLG